MGANEHGVVIGNEGLHARMPAPTDDALTGMDLLRLGLERSTTAEEALQVITSLLEQHGQGGNCGHLSPDHYHNGFMITDATRAFVLETAGKEWLAEDISGVRSMSNAYSIGESPSRCSDGLLSLIHGLGASDLGAVHYAQLLSDPNREHLGNAGTRRACTTSMLQGRAGKLDVTDMMRILRSHGTSDRYQPTLAERTVCMHASSGTRTGQTVGSMVSDVRAGRAVHWVTATAAPCISIFKPLFLDTPLAVSRCPVTDRFDPNSLWWRHEQLHRRVVPGDFASFLCDIGAERDALEAEFVARIEGARGIACRQERADIVAECWREAMAMEQRWHDRAPPFRRFAGSTHEASWVEMNDLAALRDLDRPDASVDADAASAVAEGRV